MYSSAEKPPSYSSSHIGLTENRIVSASFWSHPCFSSRVTVGHVCAIFLIALVTTVIRHVRFDEHDEFAAFITLPADANRFETPWRLPHRVKLLSISEAKSRILYSPLRTQAGEGLGYYIRNVAAEVGTALRLGLAYSHRHSQHGSLDAKEVDNLFNLTHGHLPRKLIRDVVCSMSIPPNYNNSGTNHSREALHGDDSDDRCELCGSNNIPPRKPNLLAIDRVIDLPRELTYDWSMQYEFGREGKRKIAGFMSQANHTQPYTLFQMPMGDCERRIAAQFVGPDTSSYLFHRYWDAHGGTAHLSTLKISLTNATEGEDTGQGGQTKSGIFKRSPDVGFSPKELHIAIHARRGDFFKHKRPRVAMKVYANVLKELVGVVRETGGVYGGMEVVVRVYSEGIPLLEHSSMSSISVHNMSGRTSRFQDADGSEMSYDRVEASLLGKKGEEREKLFPHGARVEMRVSKDTVRSVHEMVAADVFIGSESTLGSVVVQTLSRGALILLPYRADRNRRGGGQWRHGLRSYFDAGSGRLLERRRVRRGWRRYVGCTQTAAGIAGRV